MKDLKLPEFKTYEEEADYWDNLDTADYMTDDGEWIQLETPLKRAINIAILPEVAEVLIQQAHTQHVSVETLANVLLMKRVQPPLGVS